MSSNLDELKSTASSLPLTERAELAHYLLNTLEDPECASHEAWLVLAEQRMNEVRAKSTLGIPAEHVIESLRRPHQ